MICIIETVVKQTHQLNHLQETREINKCIKYIFSGVKTVHRIYQTHCFKTFV